MNLKSFIYSEQSGRSMVEMLGVLAIMGIITVGAIAMVSAGLRGQKRNTLQDEVVQITTGVRQLLQDYDDLDGKIDNDTIFAAIGVNHKTPYGGQYSLSVNSEDTRQFVLKIQGLSKSDCEYFKTRAWPDSVGYQKSDGSQSGAIAEPSNCSAENSGNSVDITFDGK